MPSGRTLERSTREELLEVGGPCAILLPANLEAAETEAITRALSAHGCVEFCFVGERAERAHDVADDVLESTGYLEVVTTWVNDVQEGCDYFLHAAAYARTSRLVAYVTPDPILDQALNEAVESFNDP